MSLEEAIESYIAEKNEAKKPNRPGEWVNYFDDERRLSRKGNIVVTIIEQGEYVRSGPDEDPFFDYYENVTEIVLSPTGKLLSSRHLGW